MDKYSLYGFFLYIINTTKAISNAITTKSITYKESGVYILASPDELVRL